jgi:hypothetical protein
VSTEITGYAVSTYVELGERLGGEEWIGRARKAAALLCSAWDAHSQAMPFEWSSNGDVPERHSYFFDNGIIARGLLRLWRRDGDPDLLRTAVACGRSMQRDFANEVDIHPILSLPEMTPLARDQRWSRTSGCYQLKSALAWLELAEVTGDAGFQAAFDRALERSLATHEDFLEREPERIRVMDRLHAYCYFLEALLARAGEPEVREALESGIARAERHLRTLRSEFERSDVNGQLLRVRLWADALGAVKLDERAAEYEAASAASFQMEDEDPGSDGCFNFGRRGGQLSNYANPVSTAFCLQALALWSDYQSGISTTAWRQLI